MNNNFTYKIEQKLNKKKLRQKKLKRLAKQLISNISKRKNTKIK